MAKELKKIFTSGDEVQQTFTINAWHVSQSVDALTGTEDYDITISGSLTVTGSILHAEIQNANGVASSVLVRDDSTGEYYITGSYGGGGSTDTGSLLVTASVTDNDITFEKGDGTTFTITVDTGSANGDNLYNIDGTLTNNRVVTANANDLTFEFETANFIINSDNAQRVTIANLPTSDQPQVVGIDGSGNLKAMNTSSIAGGTTDTGSLLVTSSVSNNVITFEKGDGSTYTITVDTGSGGGGSTDYVSNVAYDTGSIDFTGVGSAFNGVIDINDLTASLLTTSSFNSATGSFLTSGSFDDGSSTITLHSDNENYTLDLSSLSGGGGGLAITASDEGTVLNENVRSFDFVGNAVTASNLGNAITVTVNTGSLPLGLLSSSAQIATDISGAFDTGSFMTTGSVTDNTITFTKGDGTTFTITVDTGSGGGGSTDYVSNVVYQTGSIDFTGVGNGFDGVIDINDLTASLISNDDTGSFMTTGSVTDNTITFTKGDGTTFTITVDTGSGGTTDTGSLLVTSSVSNNTITFEKGDGSTYTITVDTGSDTNIGNTSLNLTNNRTLDFNTNNLAFDILQGEQFDVTLDIGATASFHLDDGEFRVTQLSNTSQPAVIAYNSSSGNFSYMLTSSFSGGSTDTGSLLTTGSVSSNVLTFTKGDGTSFSLTVDTGSGGGGGSTNTFATMSVGGQNIIADSSTDTLTITDGNQISSSANPTTDTYTINFLPSPQFLTKKESETAPGASQGVTSSQEIILDWTNSGPDHTNNSNHYWDINNLNDTTFEYDRTNYQFIKVKEEGMYEIEYQLYLQGTAATGSQGFIEIERTDNSLNQLEQVISQAVIGGFQNVYNAESTSRKVYYYVSQENVDADEAYFIMKLIGGTSVTGTLSVGGATTANHNLTFWSFKKLEDVGKAR